jgi:hypothetical protein
MPALVKLRLLLNVASSTQPWNLLGAGDAVGWRATGCLAVFRARAMTSIAAQRFRGVRMFQKVFYLLGMTG